MALKFSTCLMVCEANICRSPLAEAMLESICPELSADSAGLTARDHDAADATCIELAREVGLDLSEHQSKRVTRDLLSGNDLILVMTPEQKGRLAQRYPEISGKVMLLGQWTNQGTTISDPHRKSREAYQQVFDQIRAACHGWAEKIG